MELNENERLDDLQIGGLYIIQDKTKYNFTADAVLLAGFTKIKNNATVVDLGTGSGVIATLLAYKSKAKKVYGVEVVPQAIQNAIENAQMNEVRNAEFFVGEVEKVIPKLYEEGVKADVVFVDPPRKGCDMTALQTIMDMKPEKVVYISCNPATLARDLKVLTEECFEIKGVKLVDMFPQTGHVESVVLLEKR